MRVIKTRDYQESLKNILFHIAKDKKGASVSFSKTLNKKIKDLKDFPFMYKISIYFDDEQIRDITHMGYTVPYEVDLEEQTISIIGITKYKNTLK